MKKILKHFDIILICVIFICLMCVVLVRMITGIIVTQCNVSNKVTDWILKDLTIQSNIVEYDWSEKYPLEENLSETIQNKIGQIEEKINNYCTTSFPKSDMINEMVSAYKRKILSYSLDIDSGSYGNIEYISEAYQNVTEFARLCEEEAIPFLYVQAPSEDSIRYYRGEMEYISNLNIVERSKALTDKVCDAGIPVLNIGEETAGTIEYKFDYSGHWFPEEGLITAKMIADRLNRDYGFAFDLSDYELERFDDLLADYPDMSKEIKKNCGYDYQIMVPKESYSYKLVYAEEESWEGDFEQTLIAPQESWMPQGGAYHDIYRIKNSQIYSISNYSCTENVGKKILVIGDSFNWPVSVYLSIGVEQIDVIHNDSFSGSVVSYMTQMQPDMVIICYNEAEFYDIYTQGAFDLR